MKLALFTILSNNIFLSTYDFLVKIFYYYINKVILNLKKSSLKIINKYYFCIVLLALLH